MLALCDASTATSIASKSAAAKQSMTKAQSFVIQGEVCVCACGSVSVCVCLCVSDEHAEKHTGSLIQTHTHLITHTHTHTHTIAYPDQSRLGRSCCAAEKVCCLHCWEPPALAQPPAVTLSTAAVQWQWQWQPTRRHHHHPASQLPLQPRGMKRAWLRLLAERAVGLTLAAVDLTAAAAGCCVMMTRGVVVSSSAAAAAAAYVGGQGWRVGCAACGGVADAAAVQDGCETPASSAA